MNSTGKIIITGDFCPINRIDELIRLNEYELIFNDFLPILGEAELAITNLESPLTESEDKISKIGPLLKASTQSAAALSAAGFKLVTLANNHIMDYGESGLVSTFKACQDFGLDYVGAGENIQKARRIYTAKVSDRTVAIINFAENEFSTTNGTDHGANPLDIVDNYRDIIKARSIADIVLVIVHGGHEMYDLPSPRIKNTLHFFAEAGANVIIEHHAHCYSGYEVYRGVPIFYGLGNFLFDIPNMSNPIWNIGYAVELELDPELTFNIIPYQQCGKEAGISLLDGPGKEQFYANIERLNAIIADDELLEAEFRKHCFRVRNRYNSFLEPYSNSLLHSLRNKKLFPSMISDRKRKLYLNLIRCESHREIVIDLLKSGDSH